MRLASHNNMPYDLFDKIGKEEIVRRMIQKIIIEAPFEVLEDMFDIETIDPRDKKRLISQEYKYQEAERIDMVNIVVSTKEDNQPFI